MCLASPCLSLNYSGLSHHVFLDKVLLKKCIERNASFLDVQRGENHGNLSEEESRSVTFHTAGSMIHTKICLSLLRSNHSHTSFRSPWMPIGVVFLLLLLCHFPFSLEIHCYFMEGKCSFLCMECKLPLPVVCSLRTVFGWTLQSSLKGEPFPTVLWESRPFEVTAGLTKLISSLHNVPLMQCWLRLPLAGSCYWTRPKCNV